ncbi:MAG: ABC transporter ATP-binding protein [Marinilabiliaceae bacterium]|nr:ABC transporter ATP-binding protein [Marinilabiliaceae bacterium]
MSAPLITQHLSIGYKRGKRKTILHGNINVSLEEGEFVAIIGPNGAGKSTLLKTFAGFLPKLSGDIIIQNKNSDTISELERAKIISVVLTDRPFIENMSVFELVALGRTPYTGYFGKIEKKDKLLIKKSIKDVGLQGFDNKFITDLSDGERQKAFIAKALVQEAPIMLLDEPTAFLDLPSRVEIMHILKELAINKNKTILLSTHDLELAMQTADKLWLIAQGLHLKIGVPEDLAIEGIFKIYFERKGIIFDNDTGQFSTTNKNSAIPIQLIGKGIEYKWVSNALIRNGFELSNSESYLFKIEIVEKSDYKYLVSDKVSKVIKCKSVEEILKSIKEVCLQK